MTNKEIEFSEKEHEGGQHKTFQENCSTCFSENLRIQNWRKNWQDAQLLANRTGIYE